MPYGTNSYIRFLFTTIIFLLLLCYFLSLPWLISPYFLRALRYLLHHILSVSSIRYSHGRELPQRFCHCSNYLVNNTLRYAAAYAIANFFFYFFAHFLAATRRAHIWIAYLHNRDLGASAVDWLLTCKISHPSSSSSYLAFF